MLQDDRWPGCFSLAGTVQTPATKENAPLPRLVISHPGRQLKCKLKMLIRTVSTCILMHKMGILYSVRRKMHCSLGKTLLPLLLWSEQEELLFFFFFKTCRRKRRKIKENGGLRSDPDLKCWHKSTKARGVVVDLRRSGSCPVKLLTLKGGEKGYLPHNETSVSELVLLFSSCPFFKSQPI